MNIEQARFNMIEQQIRPWKVLDQQVLDIMATLPREHFVPDAYQGLAFADIAIPLGNDRFMLHPREEGRLLQAIKPKLDEKVLVINPGSGYVTALVASMAAQVVAIDTDAEFVNTTTENLATLNINNVTVDCGDCSQCWQAEAPYDVIVVLGSMQVLAEAFKQQLKIGGRIFCIIGKKPTMEALVIHRTNEDEWLEECLFETVVPALSNSLLAEQFHF
jgi:protein-L-isoaspartate(D-aspartate) O-methyltransferase